MKKVTAIVLAQVISVLVLILCLAYILSGQGAFICRGFALDSDGRLYIGRTDKIEIYHNNKLERTISARTSRGYAFTISGDKLILSDASTVYEMTLAGELTDQYEDTRSSIYHAHANNRRFVDTTGREYVRTAPLGRMQIWQDDILCYQMPLMDYCIQLLLFFAFIGVAVTIILLLKETKILRFRK